MSQCRFQDRADYSLFAAVRAKPVRQSQALALTHPLFVSKPQADREYFEQKNRFKKAEQMERRRLDIERDQQRHERQKQEMLANRCAKATGCLQTGTFLLCIG